MGDRDDLQALLEIILGSDHVYFQPPDGTRMEYPAIVYSLASEKVKYANNLTYSRRKSYQTIVIDPDPDSPIPDKVGNLPLCKFNRHYTKDNLNHYAYNLYY